MQEKRREKQAALELWSIPTHPNVGTTTQAGVRLRFHLGLPSFQHSTIVARAARHVVRRRCRRRQRAQPPAEGGARAGHHPGGHERPLHRLPVHQNDPRQVRRWNPALFICFNCDYAPFTLRAHIIIRLASWAFVAGGRCHRAKNTSVPSRMRHPKAIEALLREAGPILMLILFIIHSFIHYHARPSHF